MDVMPYASDDRRLRHLIQLPSHDYLRPGRFSTSEAPMHVPFKWRSTKYRCGLARIIATLITERIDHDRDSHEEPSVAGVKTTASVCRRDDYACESVERTAGSRDRSRARNTFGGDCSFDLSSRRKRPRRACARSILRRSGRREYRSSERERNAIYTRLSFSLPPGYRSPSRAIGAPSHVVSSCPRSSCRYVPITNLPSGPLSQELEHMPLPP